MSKKVKARKLPMVERFEVEEGSADGDCCRNRPDDDDCKPLRRPEIVRVYSRRRKRSPRESLVGGGGGDAESLELDDERNQKKRRIGEEGSSSVMRSFTGSGLRGCSSGSKQNGASRRKGSSVKSQDKVSLASSGSTKKWVRLVFFYHFLCYLFSWSCCMMMREF